MSVMDVEDTGDAGTTVVTDEAQHGSKQVADALADVEGQKAHEAFMATVPETLREHQSLKNVKGVEDLVTQYVNQQSLIGNSIRIPTKDTDAATADAFYKKLMDVPGVVRLPGEDADESVWNEFNAKLGVPATADEYQVNLPEGTTLEPEFIQQATAKAHAMKLNNKQLNDALADEVALRSKVAEDYENYVIKSKQELKAIWSDDYDNRVAGAAQAFRLYKQEMPEYAAELDALKDNPIFVKLLSDRAASMKEAGHAGIQAASNYGMSVEDAKIKRSEIQSNRDHDYFKGDEEAVNYMLKLNRIIAGASA